MRKTKIVISGYYGFGNAGDEAMLTAILESLYNEQPNLDITVISGNPAKTGRTHGVKAVPRLHFPLIWHTLRQCDLLISGGGSLLQDVTSKRSLYYYLSIMKMAQWIGKKVFLYAQGIGPLTRTHARSTVADVLNRCDYITVRDQKSADLLQELGVTQVPVRVTADAVLAMHPVDRGISEALLAKYGIGGIAPKVGIYVRNWKGDGLYKQVVAQAADRLIREEGCKVIFVPMQVPDDVMAARNIQSYMHESACVLTDEYTTAEMMSIAGNMDVVLGVRLHALVFAALMHVPLVGISYDPKVDSFLHMIHESAQGNLQDVSADALVAAVGRKLRADHSEEEVHRAVVNLRYQSELTAELALGLCK